MTRTRVCHKLDGTLCLIWQNPHTYEWSVGNPICVPDADLPIDNFPDYTFRTLFERAFKETMGSEYRDYANKNLDPDCTYMFELTTPYNKVVCVYNGGAIFRGARRLAAAARFERAGGGPPPQRRPLVVERRFGKGRVVAFLTTAAPTWNNWARVNPSFRGGHAGLAGVFVRAARGGRVAVGRLAAGAEPGSGRLPAASPLHPARAVRRAGGGSQCRPRRRQKC